jgi:hypothetical protein
MIIAVDPAARRMAVDEWAAVDAEVWRKWNVIDAGFPGGRYECVT